MPNLQKNAGGIWCNESMARCLGI